MFLESDRVSKILNMPSGPFACGLGWIIYAIALTLQGGASSSFANDDVTPLFDGKSLEHWEGSKDFFRVEDGAIVGGSTQRDTPQNEFLVFEDDFADFELSLEFKLVGEKTNSGVQIRSERIPDHHEMKGYQADLGEGYWGALYDESRRNKILQAPSKDTVEKALKPGEWNKYRIRCEGPRIRLWLNDVLTVDYLEEDPSIPLKGKIAVQIHSGPPGEAWFRKLEIRHITSEKQQSRP